MTDKTLGLYLHIPFCAAKCAYCDFYAAFPGGDLLERYTARLAEEIKRWGGVLDRPILHTVYFGGGTPSLLGDGLIPIMQAVRCAFRLERDAEITLEMNPASENSAVLRAAKAAGVNRLSIGAQSGDDEMLRRLGRRHTAADTRAAVREARAAGFHNISLDLMLGLPDSGLKTLQKDIDFILSAEPSHISAYILKLEQNTAFYQRRDALNLPDDDSAAEQYLYLCERLEKNGYSHYEISNFCRAGAESRHNLTYWRCEEYLGIGPSAHSFINGERFYYPRDLKAFMRGESTVSDGSGGDKAEYMMLRLRLAAGLRLSDYRARFGEDLPDGVRDAALPLVRAGLVHLTEDAIALTDRGMLVSNSIITELSEKL